MLEEGFLSRFLPLAGTSRRGVHGLLAKASISNGDGMSFSASCGEMEEPDRVPEISGDWPGSGLGRFSAHL